MVNLLKGKTIKSSEFIDEDGIRSLKIEFSSGDEVKISPEKEPMGKSLNQSVAMIFPFPEDS